MSELPSPLLSPSFAKASRLSRLLAVLFAIGFWVTLALALAAPALIVWPESGSVMLQDLAINLHALSLGRRILAILMAEASFATSLVILHHARKTFACFAEGDVFSATPIAHIRAAGIWLMVSFLIAPAAQIFVNLAMGKHPVAGDLDLQPLILIFGIATTIAAYVMAEAQRIADDNASIL